MNLETYARVLAQVACRRGTRIEEILAELGVDAAQLREAEAAFRQELVEMWPNRKGILAMKFASVLGEELVKLDPIGAQSGGGERPTGPAPEARPRTAEVAVPSYMREPTASPSPPSGGFALPSAVSAMLADPLAPKPGPGVTADADISSIVAALERGALPFARAEGARSDGSAAAGSAPPGAASASPARNPVPNHVPTGTMSADLASIVANIGKHGALPFAPAKDGAPEAAPPSFGATTPAPVSASSVHAATMLLPATPAPEEVDLAAFPLEVYATITGALARGEAREEALARHRLDAASFDKLAKAWAQRFAKEPQLLVRFKELARTSAGR